MCSLDVYSPDVFLSNIRLYLVSFDARRGRRRRDRGAVGLVGRVDAPRGGRHRADDRRVRGRLAAHANPRRPSGRRGRHDHVRGRRARRRPRARRRGAGRGTPDDRARRRPDGRRPGVPPRDRRADLRGLSKRARRRPVQRSPGGAAGVGARVGVRAVRPPRGPPGVRQRFRGAGRSRVLDAPPSAERGAAPTPLRGALPGGGAARRGRDRRARDAGRRADRGSRPDRDRAVGGASRDSRRRSRCRRRARGADARAREYAPVADLLDIGRAAFELYADRAGKHRFRLRHRNGNILLDSGQGYAARRGARDGVERIRRYAPLAPIEPLDGREPEPRDEDESGTGGEADPDARVEEPVADPDAT